MTAGWISALNYPISLGGFNVPIITLAIGLLIAILGVYFGFKDFIEVRKLSNQLENLIKEFRSQKKPIDQATMNSLMNAFQQEYISQELRECWDEFRETLLPEKTDNGDINYTNTLQAEQFFTVSFIGKNLSSLTHSLPSLATGAGLLGTFIALLIGLAELHVVDGGAVEGIGPFINALSGKFFSSIFGLGTALALTFYINRIRRPWVESKLHAFQHQINVLFPRKSAETILLDMRKILVRTDSTVSHLATDMATKLPEVIKDTLGGDMQSLLNAINNLGAATEALRDVDSVQLQQSLSSIETIREGIDKLQTQNSEAITESIDRLLDKFTQNLHQSASSEMQHLASSMQQAAQVLEGMHSRSELEDQRQQLADERLTRMIETLEQGLEKQQAQANAIGEQMDQLLKQIVDQAGVLNESGQQSVQEQMKRIIQDNEAQSQAWRQQIEGLLTQTLDQFQNGSQQQIQQLASQSGDMAKRLETLLSRLDETGQQQQSQAREALSAMQSQLEYSSREYDEQVKRQQQEINNALEEAVKKLATFMEERESGLQIAYQRLGETQQALASTLESGSQELGQTVDGLKQTLLLTKSSMEQLNSAQSTLSDSVVAFNTAQSIVTEGVRDANMTAEKYQKSIEAMQTLHDRQSVVYKELEQRLGTVLATINTNLETYTVRMNSGLSANLKEWDQEFRNASQAFAGIVTDVKESADDLSDAMEGLSNKLVSNNGKRESVNV